jgi:Arc/MetJ family transcription regulator
MRKQYDFSQAKRGAVVATPPGKTRITIRLDDDVLAWFKERVREAGGGNYQTLINEALKTYINLRREPLEDILRRVIREELDTSASSRTQTPRRPSRPRG